MRLAKIINNELKTLSFFSVRLFYCRLSGKPLREALLYHMFRLLPSHNEVTHSAARKAARQQLQPIIRENRNSQSNKYIFVAQNYYPGYSMTFLRNRVQRQVMKVVMVR